MAIVKDVKIPLLIGNIWLAVFVWVSIIHFSRCGDIQKELENSLRKKHSNSSFKKTYPDSVKLTGDE